LKKFNNNVGNEIKIFAETIEEVAYEQIKRLSNFKAYENSKFRIMPDCHAGAGCTIGTTMTVDDKITPNLVGVDIGCGMLTVELSNKRVDLMKLDKVINAKVPHGFNVHDNPQIEFLSPALFCKKHVDVERGLRAVGTLGGGNHFIEIAQSKDNVSYLIIHSGSRSIGNQVAKHYQELAVKSLYRKSEFKVTELIFRLKDEGREKDISAELLKLKGKGAEQEKMFGDLAYLEGEHRNRYMHDLNSMQEYAALNRAKIADIIFENTNIKPVDRIETIHNYVDFKRMILRKGAVSAEKGEQLLIPMNMRDGSLLCVGKGNEDWNYSAPHGAGRLMSRKKAKQVLDMSEFEKQMENVYSTSVVKGTLDEAPNAYKPMKEIINQIKDTVDIVDILKPIYNFKSH